MNFTEDSWHKRRYLRWHKQKFGYRRGEPMMSLAEKTKKMAQPNSYYGFWSVDTYDPPTNANLCPYVRVVLFWSWWRNLGWEVDRWMDRQIEKRPPEKRLNFITRALLIIAMVVPLILVAILHSAHPIYLYAAFVAGACISKFLRWAYDREAVQKAGASTKEGFKRTGKVIVDIFGLMREKSRAVHDGICPSIYFGDKK